MQASWEPGAFRRYVYRETMFPLRRLRDQSDRVRSLSEEVFWLRIALDGAKAGKEALKARLVKLRAVGATLSKLPSDEAAQLRATLRRPRRQKTTINVLRKENARLYRSVQASKAGREASEARLGRLRTVRKTLSTSLSSTDAELRKALRRSRHQKATLKSLSREKGPVTVLYNLWPLRYRSVAGGAGQSALRAGVDL